MQAVDKEIAFLCVISYLSPHFEDTAQRVKTCLRMIPDLD